MDGAEIFDVYRAKPHSEESKWICVYPLYLNARKTIAHGRRVSKNKAIDAPTSQEIFDVLTIAGFKVKLEKHAMHPLDPNRDPCAQGRVRVQLRNDDGTPFNAKFPTRMSLLLYLCEMIPRLKNRQSGSSGLGAQSAIPGTKANKKHKKR